MKWELVIALCIGIGLSAACGFRVFLPFLVMSIANRSGYLTLSSGFDWIGSETALIVFSVASAVEILAYYIPWVDNALDTITGPLAVIAGTLTTASVFEMDPVMKWSLAIIAGGSSAALMKGGVSVIRGFSTLATGGITNFIIATLEIIFALFLAILAILLPVLAVIALIIGVTLVIKRKLFSKAMPPRVCA
jgi:hypothetical protein